MKITTFQYYTALFNTFPELEGCRKALDQAFEILADCYRQKGKVLICGNGGSASDAEHIVGELMKGFLCKREITMEDREKLRRHFKEDGDYLSDHLQQALPAISLVSQSALSTAFINDVAADMVFAQQVYGYGKPGDVLMGLSTSGNSRNVVHACRVARAFEIKTIGLTGEDGGAMKGLCDVCICVPSAQTYRIQEYHLPIYHTLCAMIEAEFFVDEPREHSCK